MHCLFISWIHFAAYLEELEQLLKGIAMMKELTLRTRDYLVSFGECLSTRIFAAYLNTIGVKARQYDAFEIGFITTDDFTNGDILEATYPAVAKRLYDDWMHDPAVPIVTGFLGKGWKTGAVTTLGRGGSDLTATTIGKALGLKEIQVWKDVDGVLTCDPTIYKRATPVPYLTFDEAAELAYFGAQVLHPQSMRPAREGEIPVRVKNSYNPKAPGTIITKTRDMTKSILTSIVLKRNVTMLDIASTRMLGQVGFLAKVFSIFEELGISVDVVATSEVSISLTLDPSKLWSRELIQQELDHVVEELEKIAVVNLLKGRAIISLIGNVQHSSLILERAFHVLYTKGVNVQMISQGASKVNISFIVNEAEAEGCVQALHKSFFESGDLSELLIQPRLGNGSPVRTLQVEN
jgi:aspartate kinase